MWESKERDWKERQKKMEEQHAGEVESFRSSDEERRLEVDMLKARVLELEVVNTMAKWASVGVQATFEDEEHGEVCKRLDAEEKLACVRRENEELRRSLVEMKADCKEESHRCINCDLQSKRKEVQCVDERKPQSSIKHEDDLRREYESQIRNVRELRGMYEERMRAAEEQSRKLREELQEKTRRLELSRRRCSELRAHSQELETLLGEQEGVARGLQARLSASLEEGRTLAAQLAMVNRLFGRLGDTAELDFERLRLLQNSGEGGASEDSSDCAGGNNSGNKGDAGCSSSSRSKEEASDLKEIAVSLPKVWRLLVELLGEEQKEEEKVSERSMDTEECFESVPTPYGPRLVISVSRTFIRLKDLILEKKSLQNELGRIRDLNGRLESKLNQQERRLATVKVELKRTWSLVARMRAQHKQLHTSEQVLRYELQQKRKLLGELKQELEYCREKWDLARVKNSQSEKEWQLLRQEFTARRSVEGDHMLESTEVNSPESGFSDGRGEDEEEEEMEEVGEDLIATMEYLKRSAEDSSEREIDGCIRLQTETSSPFVEENQMLPLRVDSLDSKSNFELEDSNSREGGTENNDSDATQSENKFLNRDGISTDEASLCPSGDCTQVNVADSSGMPDSANLQPAGVSAERSIEERLLARAERLRCLEEQCSLLFRKVTHTTTRSAELSSRLEELHEQYGEQPAAREESGQEISVLADTETGEIPPEVVPPLMVHAHLEAAAPQPPMPPPLPVSFPPIRLPSLIDHLPCHSSETDSKLQLTLPVESESCSVGPAENFFLPSSSALDTKIIPEASLHSILSTSGESNESANPVVSELLTSREPENPPEEGDNISLHTEESNLPNEELRSASVTGSFPSMVEQPEVAAPLLTSQSISEESLNISGVQEEMLEYEMESVVTSMEGSNVDVGTSRDEELGGVIDDGVDSDSSVEPSRERLVEEIGLEDREEINEEAYIDGMSSTIYGLHHGPLFDDEGTSLSEEECGEDIAEEDYDDDEPDEDGVNVTSGSIGVASLLLQQLPKRMDILRRERHSLEQRLEEGEAALGRALAGTAAAEHRARILEQGLAQAQERLRVLEMEAAVERNERLLEIKSALDMNGANVDDCPENAAEREQCDAGHLQEEIDSLQRATMAQIAGLQAAAVVSKAQTEQLSDLTEEVERQERIVNTLKIELTSLRQEREEQAEALNNTRESLKETLELLARRQRESDAMELQLQKLRMESEQSNKENIGLFSRLAAAESEVTRLNAEIQQLKDDSDHLREAVIRLTGEKEVLFRANHHLEEMRRLMLEDSRWVADRESEVCTACGVAFSLLVRRHHCRSCGKIFCGACSSHWLALNPTSQGTSSLVTGVVDSLMGVTGSGKRSRACADCFAAYSADNREEREVPVTFFSQGGMVNNQSDSLKMPENGSVLPEGTSDIAGEAAEGVQGGDNDDDYDDDDLEDFSMISEEEVVLSQCTPYVPNPRTLQYWKSCEIQSGVMSTVPDLLAACIPDGGEPGRGQREKVWVRAGAIYSVPLLIQETHVSILWEFSTNPNSIAFSVLYKSGAEIPMSCALIIVPTTRVNSHLNLVHGRLCPKRAGVYILMFDNSFSRFTGKTISYCLRAEVPSSGRESIVSSSRSSVERFPDLPVHQEGVVEEDTEGEERIDVASVDEMEDGSQWEQRD